jgi:hypothetical protein
MSSYQDYGRHEFKYALPLRARGDLLRIAGKNAQPDPHSVPREDGLLGYYIHSLYLDTHDLLDYHQRLSERKVRNRLRARTYGRPGDRAPVFLENKRKVDEWVVKQRVRVCDADTWANHSHDRPWIEHARAVNGPGRFAARSFLSLVENGRQPVSTVHYFREVFVDRRGDGCNRVRLTMDREITATVRPSGRDLYAPPDVELMPADWMVLELKYSHNRPGWMREICRELGLRALPIPKFGLSVARGERVDHPLEQSRLMPKPLREMGWGA